MIATSADGTEIHYEVTGQQHDTALVFVHGWLGNTRWWDAQRSALEDTYRIVALDLAGHGQSGRTRTQWTAEAYAADIVAVVRAVAAPRVVLVGHSMAGAYVTAACPELPSVAGLVLVDTVKNLETIPTYEQVAPMLAGYGSDFETMVKTRLASMLFTPRTPPAVVEQLTREFLSVPGDYAARLLEPLYRFDIRSAARRVRVPVRGIGTTEDAGGIAVNRTYFADYDYVAMAPFGHYPMLEAPEYFTQILRDQAARILAPSSSGSLV